MVRCATRFDADQAGWLLGKELQQLAAAELSPDHNLSCRVDTVYLEHVLRQI